MENNLRYFRCKNHLTGEEVATYLNIAPSTYRCYETGRRMIKIKHLIELAKLYGVEPEAIIPALRIKIKNYKETKIYVD